VAVGLAEIAPEHGLVGAVGDVALEVGQVDADVRVFAAQEVEFLLGARVVAHDHGVLHGQADQLGGARQGAVHLLHHALALPGGADEHQRREHRHADAQHQGRDLGADVVAQGVEHGRRPSARR
jgi:hypothetical protein